MLKRTIVFMASFLLTLIISSCNSANTNNTEIYNKNKNWSEYDSEVIADSIVKRLLLSELNKNISINRKPKLIIGSVENLTKEKIDTDLVSKNIERSFINSGKVTFISSKSKREETRSDRRNINNFKNDNELKKYLKPLKSDFFISGNLQLNVDSTSSPLLKEYKLTLEIIKAKNIELVSTISEIIIK